MATPPRKAGSSITQWTRKAKPFCRAPAPEGRGSRWIQSPYHATASRTFNSLFKVLCIFRSLYLFAIGLAPIFSLTRDIPGKLDQQSQASRLLHPQSMNGRKGVVQRGYHAHWRAVPGNFPTALPRAPQRLPYNSTVSSVTPPPIQGWAVG